MILFYYISEFMQDFFYILYRQIYVEKYVETSVLYDGVTYLLEELEKKKAVLCIATMKTAKQVEKLLPCLGIEDYFSQVLCASEDGSLKKTDMIRHLKSSYCEEDVFMVGDTMGDYESAKSADVRFIGAGYGYGEFVGIREPVVQKPSEILNQIL